MPSGLSNLCRSEVLESKYLFVKILNFKQSEQSSKKLSSSRQTIRRHCLLETKSFVSQIKHIMIQTLLRIRQFPSKREYFVIYFKHRKIHKRRSYYIPSWNSNSVSLLANIIPSFLSLVSPPLSIPRKKRIWAFLSFFSLPSVHI
jgi:hypothetical protein